MSLANFKNKNFDIRILLDKEQIIKFIVDNYQFI